MYKHILVPVDPEGLSDTALAHATGLATAFGSRVSLMTMAEPVYAHLAQAGEIHDAFEHEASSTARAAGLLQVASRKLRAANVDFDTIIFSGERPWESIAKAAEDHDCDLIVMATRGGKHIDGFVFGSVAASVLTRSNVPLLVIRDDQDF
ncbi:MAG: universal stress protein [Beijerinckiaceae bacterium]